jgi:hypothetical protein
VVDVEHVVAVGDGAEVAVSCGERAVGDPGDPIL